MPTPRDPDASPFLLEAGRQAALTELAAAGHREPGEMLNEAVDSYLAHQRWMLDEMQAGLRESRAGDFLPDDQAAAAFEGW